MKKIIIIILLGLLIPFNDVKALENEANLYLFYGDGCPHCSAQKEYLNEIKDNYPNLKIYLYEVWYNKENASLYNLVKEKIGYDKSSVPFTVIGTNYMVGFADFKKEELKIMIENNLNNPSVDVVAEIINNNDIKDLKFSMIDPSGIVNLPLIGKVNIKEVSLPLVAVVLGIVDGFNPCAMWVLIFLLTLLLNMKNKSKAFTLGAVFLVTSALVYFLFMMSWLKVAASAVSISWLRILIGAVALLASLFNFYKYIKERNKDGGCDVVSNKQRTTIMTKTKQILSNKSFLLALLGVIILACVVNVIELACSLGLPLMFTGILAFNNISPFMTVIYMLLYILFFLIDDLIIFIIAMVTFKITGISTKYTKYSHLIGGLIMFIMGILLILKPEWVMFNFN